MTAYPSPAPSVLDPLFAAAAVPCAPDLYEYAPPAARALRGGGAIVGWVDGLGRQRCVACHGQAPRPDPVDAVWAHGLPCRRVGADAVRLCCGCGADVDAVAWVAAGVTVAWWAGGLWRYGVAVAARGDRVEVANAAAGRRGWVPAALCSVVR